MLAEIWIAPGSEGPPGPNCSWFCPPPPCLTKTRSGPWNVKSADCTGNILVGESKTCIITNDDNAAPTNVILELTRSHSGHFLDNTDDNDCADGNIIAVTAVGFTFDPVFIKIKSSGINDCNVGLRQWDVSSIPDNAEIISVEWLATFHQNPGNQYPPICDIVQLDTQPSTAIDVQALMDEINSNPSFVDDDSFCSSGGAKTVNLGPAAVAHLENVSLLNDWFAFAIKARPDTTQQSFHQSTYSDEVNNPTTLRVVYTIPGGSTGTTTERNRSRPGGTLGGHPPT